MANALEELTGGIRAPDTLSYQGTFTLTEIDPPGKRQARHFTAIMMTMPVVTAGYGGWSRVARPRAKALTEWAGHDSISMTWDFMLDEFVSGDSAYVEERCRNLDKMAGMQENVEPPLVTVVSDPALMIPYGAGWAPNRRWFIESLNWLPDRTLVGRAGRRLRAAGSITVTQFVEDKRLSMVKRKKDENKGKDNDKGKGGKRKSYRVKTGDTLQKIAARKDVYGDKDKWKKIAKANDIRDPKKLKVGQVLKIP